MIRLSIFASPEWLDALSCKLFEAGASGLEERPGGLAVYARDDAELASFSSAIESFRQSLPSSAAANVETEREVIDAAWQTAWQDALKPQQVTPRWTMRPTHCAPAPRGEDTLWFEPDQCFGEGAHETTRLAATHLETYLKPGQSVFDVGTGSGVLALIAAQSGASKVLAVDNDPISVNAARRNAAHNQLDDRIEVRLGSAKDADGLFDWVVANINTNILATLLPNLCQTMKEDGALVMTGLLFEDEHELVLLAQGHGLRLLSTQRLGEWSLLELRRA